jgi:hypothetical protein
MEREKISKGIGQGQLRFDNKNDVQTEVVLETQ